jgi:hypothetical protein
VRNRIAFIASIIFLGLAIASTPVLADVIPLSSLSLVGTSQIISGGTLRLTPNYDTDPSGAAPAGAAWTNSQYNVAAPFSVNFKFQMSSPCLNSLTDTPPCVNDNGNGGDGIAFLIQNSAQGSSAIGEGAGGMGFLGITDSVAVMLDTYQNNSPNYYGDPSNNYISVNTRGTDFNVPHHFCTNGQLTDITSGPMAGQSDLTGSSLSPDCTGSPTLGMQTIDPSVDNMDVGVHDVQITYNGSLLDVYLDSTLYLSVALDLATTLNLQGGDDAFLGFTAGTRFAYQNQDILSFSEAPIPEPIWGQLWVPLAMFLVVALGRKWKRARP